MRRPGRPRINDHPSPLSIDLILRWADEYHERTGHWPRTHWGTIGPGITDSWRSVDHALRHGTRGLPHGLSLLRLLAQKRGVIRGYESLTSKQILAWVDAHHARTGTWPTKRSGPVHESPRETWMGLNRALIHGGRGLTAGLTLSRLLATERGVTPHRSISRPLTIEQVLAWADAHHARTGTWPNLDSGPVHGVRGETWQNLNRSMFRGSRGLPPGGSVARLLAQERGVPLHRLKNASYRRPLTVRQILRWADAHFKRTGEWPQAGPIHGVPGETW